ncbi:hypothetical protein BT96DRAFT_925575 [Gymnopus androsaceus JB14]|uniref:Protein-S-isoprenylcysteine O-methyltransferase n=1 Tax=Gymnopus androsaceus JB14 TaxID=1447944 RepID=A0A6A4GZZ2_9AGAR|nr:hypothetical protein BT96DRAFT_925575 [Gymnopus androsaceus JB14]
MALDKLPLLFTLSIFYYIAMTPPNPPASREEISKYPHGDRMSGRAVSLAAALKTLLLTLVFCEATVIVSTHYTTSVFAEITMTALVRTSSHEFHAPATTHIFLVGFFLTLSGAYVRWSSYRALGPLFTFEVSIRDQHKLITTGPYSIVRHPGYTGVVCVFTGILLCIFGPGSWIYECGWWDLVSVKIFAMFIAAINASFVSLLLSRMGTEDKMMEKEFGLQWDAWAKNVPYKLVPGIF